MTMTLASFNRMVQDVTHRPKRQIGWTTTFHCTSSRRTGHHSPDLSPIDNLWSILSLSVYRDPEPTNVVQLKRRLQQAWRSVEVEMLQTLIESMPDRILAVIKQNGSIVKY